MSLRERVTALEKQRNVDRDIERLEDRVQYLESKLGAIMVLLNIEIKNANAVAVYKGEKP